MTSQLSRRSLEAHVNREVEQVAREHTVVRQQGRPCRICADPDARRRVNLMLSHGMVLPEIEKNITDLNQGRKKSERIGYWSLQHHRANHFNVQEPAREAYRRVLERRRQEEGELLGEAVGSILTARGYLEIIANKGFEELVKDDTKVGFTTGLDAQLKLEELIKEDQDQAALMALRRDVSLIQQAIVAELDEEQMKAVSRRLDILRGIRSEDDDDRMIEGEIIDDAHDDGYADTADFEEDGDND